MYSRIGSSRTRELIAKEDRDSTHRASIAGSIMDAKGVRQLLYWCAYMVVVPIGFIAMLWFVGWLVKSPNGTFAEIFGTCELLPLGALLLLSVSADIRSEEDAHTGVWFASLAMASWLYAGYAAVHTVSVKAVLAKVQYQRSRHEQSRVDARS